MARWGHSRFEFHSSKFLQSPVQISHFSSANLIFLQCKSHISPVQISHFSSANLTFLQCKSIQWASAHARGLIVVLYHQVPVSSSENAATVVASAAAWDTARPIDTLLLSRRVHVPYDIVLYTFSAWNNTVVATTKEGSLQTRTKETSR